MMVEMTRMGIQCLWRCPSRRKPGHYLRLHYDHSKGWIGKYGGTGISTCLSFSLPEDKESGFYIWVGNNPADQNVRN